MTYSRLEQTNRALRKAAVEVARSGSAGATPTREQIIEVVEEHIGWDFDEREATVVLQAYRAEKNGPTDCPICGGMGCEFCPRVDG